MTKKQKRAIFELILGIVFGIPTLPEIFNGVFIEMFKMGNKSVAIGIVTFGFLSVLLFLDSIAIACGFKNLGDLLEKFGYEED